MQDTLRRNIEIFKQKYFPKSSSKFTCNKTNPKCYWPLSKRILNNKKIPCVTSAILNNKLVTDFKEKVNY